MYALFSRSLPFKLLHAGTTAAAAAAATLASIYEYQRLFLLSQQNLDSAFSSVCLPVSLALSQSAMRIKLPSR